MIVYGNPQEVEEYFADSSVNQSYLKQLIKGVDFLGEKEEDLYYKEKGHFIIGGAVDVYITQGPENFNEQYYISTGNKPSDAIMSIVKMVFDENVSDGEPSQSPLEDFEEDILSSLDYHKYQSRWKTETRIAKVLEEGAQYFAELQESYGKKVLSHDEFQLINNIIMAINTGKYTANYFKDSKDVDIYYQVPIYFDYEGVPCKALLDMLRIDHYDLTLEPIDLKTMSSFTAQFPSNVKSFGYNIQGAFYHQALRALRDGKAKCDKIKLDHDVIDKYKIKMFKFIVETTHTVKNKLTEEIQYFTGKPLVYQLSPAQMFLGKYGRPTITLHGVAENQGHTSPETVQYKEVKGFHQGIELYKWHAEHGFEEDKMIVESKGIIQVE